MKYLILLLLFSPISIWAQPITTSPALPIQNAAVTITFDATQGNKGLLAYTGDIYAHTGVITDKSASGSDWKYTKAAWSNNTSSCKLTRISTNTYQLSISPDIRSFYGVSISEKILKMAFVFRSADGLKTGRDNGGKDLFVDTYESGLNVSFFNPIGLFTLVQENQSLNVQVNASENDSICLFLDQLRIKSTTGQTLSQPIITTGIQKHTLVAIAYKGNQTVSDTAVYLVKGTVENATLPVGAKDGITYPNDTSATFVLFAPNKSNVYLIGDFNQWIPDNTYLMKKDANRYWLTITGLTPGKEYIFQYLIDDSIRIADPYSEKISDPYNDASISSTTYPNLISYPLTKTTEIAGVIQPGQTDYAWQVSDFSPPKPQNLVVYELLIRDFSANKNIQTVTDSLPYLKRLGINAIELMPFNEFEGNDSWGYNPSFYFAPDKAYGTKYDYKQFVDECHRNGIAVIQDLVLNHSYGSSPMVRMYFANGAPTVVSPWYNTSSNMQNPSLQYGYDFNHESIYTQQFVDSVASFWMSQYHIDGFRYDFTKGFSNTPYSVTSWGSDYDADRVRILKRMTNAVRQRNPLAYVIFEHLADNTEETVLANNGIMLWGNLNYNYNQATMGYADGWDFSWINYKNRNWANPQAMGYMESHDEERLMYKNLTYGNASGTYDIKTLNTALKRMELTNCFFYTIPGPKMLWQFGEVGYSTSIDSGGRLSNKPIHWEYYTQFNRWHLYQVCKALITLKTTEPVFETTNYSLDLTNAIKLIKLNDAATNIVVMGNFGVTDQTIKPNFSLNGVWYEYFRGDSITVADSSFSILLKAGEFRLYANRKLTGFASIPTPTAEILQTHGTLVYPNPFSSIIRIESSSTIIEKVLYTMQGKPLLKIRNADTSIATQNIPSGMYILRIKNRNGETFTSKIVKE